MLKPFKIINKTTDRSKSASFDRYLREISKFKPFDSPEEELVVANMARNGDESAKRELIERNLRFVISVAKQYTGPGLLMEDLVNEGNCGLLKAASKFDSEKGFKFISYAVWWIRQSILCYIYTQGRGMRLPTNQINRLNKIKRAFIKLDQALEREPSTDEVLEYMNNSVPFEDVEMLLSIDRYTLSLDNKIKENDEDTILSIIEDKDSKHPIEDLHKEDFRKRVLNLIGLLSPNEGYVLVNNFGLDGKNPKNFTEIGIDLDLTRE